MLHTVQRTPYRPMACVAPYGIKCIIQTQRSDTAPGLMVYLVSNRDSFLADAMEFEARAAGMRGRADRPGTVIQKLYKVVQ